MPILEVDGKTLCGSTGIARFLAERFGELNYRKCFTPSFHLSFPPIFSPSIPLSGLAGSNDLENAELWGIIDSVNDKMNDLAKVFTEKDETKKVSAHLSVHNGSDTNGLTDCG